MARGWPRIRLLSGAGVGEIPDGHRWDAPPKVRFARDSPLEGDGFEPSVPRVMEVDLGRQVPALIAVFELAGTAVTSQRGTKCQRRTV
jgi:hypothetical protein